MPGDPSTFCSMKKYGNAENYVPTWPHFQDFRWHFSAHARILSTPSRVGEKENNRHFVSRKDRIKAMMITQLE